MLDCRQMHAVFIQNIIPFALLRDDHEEQWQHILIVLLLAKKVY